MKKRVLSVLLAAVMVFSMAGCSGGGSSSESSDDTAASASEDSGSSDAAEEETEIQVFIAASLNTVMTEIAELYNEDHPNVKITYNADSSGTLLTQIQEGYEYLLITVDGKPAGYTGFHSDENGKLFLSKLYVHKNFRGTGLARKAFTYLQERCRKEGLSAIWLTVNRFNSNTIAIYRHFGFTVIREEKNDIGGGYYMDDYIMEVPIEN